MNKEANVLAKLSVGLISITMIFDLAFIIGSWIGLSLSLTFDGTMSKADIVFANRTVFTGSFTVLLFAIAIYSFGHYIVAVGQCVMLWNGYTCDGSSRRCTKVYND